MLSLTLMLIFITMAHCTYPSIFGLSHSEKIYLGQAVENQELDEFAGEEVQKVEITAIMLESRPIQSAIRTDGKTLACSSGYLHVARPINSQIFIQCLPRASPFP